MKVLITIIIIVNSLIINGQTLKETEEWIKEQIESNSYTSSDMRTSITYNVTFNDNHMIIKKRLKYDYNNGTVSDILFTNIFPLKNLARITFRQAEDLVWMKISTNGFDKDVKSICNVYNTVKYVNYVEYQLGNSINNNNLKNRLTKAFNHLIVLNGGKIVKDVF